MRCLALLVTPLAVAAALPAGAQARPRDTDRDGLSDRREMRRFHTNPRRRDTDRDGLGDGREVRRYRTRPRRRDTDRDGLSDGREVRRLHTNPRRRDTDRDGLGDGYEVRHGFLPRDPLSPPRPPPGRPQDRTAPQAFITAGPSGTTTATTAGFAFAASEPGAHFLCRIDGRPWRSCASPFVVAGLATGPHAFQVTAQDAAGNVDLTPATRTWVVVAGPPPPLADVFISPSGSDANPCTRAAPCRSFDRGYRRAAPGEAVEAAGGSYGSQAIAHDPSKTSADDVVIRPAAGAAVSAGDVTSYASHLTVADMSVRDVAARVTDPPGATPTDVTFQNLDARNFMVLSATNVRILGGDYGPASDCGGPHGGGNNSIRQYPGAAQPANVLIEGALIHDIVSYDLGACHMEGLAVFAGRNVTVRKSAFWGNSVYDVFLQPNSGAVSDVKLENNWFSAPVGRAGSGSGASTVAFSGSSRDFANTLVRHNSFNGPFSLDDNGVNPAYSNFRVIGNIGQLPFGACGLRVTYAYNVWKNAACNATEVNLGGAALPYRNASNLLGLDYHLGGGPAVDRVPASASDLADDIDGQSRPRGRQRDAGADETG